MIVEIAWKNIWRKKVRSTVILVAIALGITAGIFNMGFYYGMIDQRIESAINSEASHLQIHDTSYMTDPDIRYYITGAAPIRENTEALPEVAATSARTIVNSMALTAETGVGVQIMGIDPEAERQVTNIHSKMVEGSYFDEEVNHPILIGKELSEKLDVGTGNRIILHLQTLDGTMTRGRFKVVGIYSISNAQYEERNVFVDRSDLQGIVGLPEGAAHEIAVLLKSNQAVDRITAGLSDSYPRLAVDPWDELMPEVSLIEESMDITMYFIMIIILFALCFGIINTMLMAVLERVKELGMLKAVGMNKRRVFAMVMFETVLLTLTGGVLGLGMGYLVIGVTGSTGLDLSIYSQAWEQLGYDPVIYPTIGLSNLAMVTLLVVLTGLLASIYPAVKAIRLNPAEALKTDV